MDDFDRTALLQRCVRLGARATELSGRIKTLRAEQDRLLPIVGTAKAKLELADEIEGAIERLIEEAHADSVGAYERLLSLLLNDVFPGSGEVSLELLSERDAPALYFNIKSQKYGLPHLDDVEDDTGGMVTNVIIMGLRISTIARAGLRDFVVLDEPDCFTTNEYMKAYAKMISDLGKLAQMQTLLISHNDVNNFKGLANITEVVKDVHDVVHVYPESDPIALWEDEAQPGLRYIRVVNVKGHADSHWPLYPGVNMLVGKPNTGKSTLAAVALRAVAYGEARDNLIQTGKPFAQIEIGIEDGYSILYTRRRNGSPKVTYTLTSPTGDVMHESSPKTKGDVPAWVIEKLNIKKVENLDVQISRQKVPLSLLNESPSVRAKLLSVGRESIRLAKLNDLWLKEKRGARNAVNQDQPRLEQLLAAMPGLEEALELSDVLKERQEVLGQLLGRFTARKAAVSDARAITQLGAKDQMLREVVSFLTDKLPAMPSLRDTATMRRSAKVLATAFERAKLIVPEVAELPRLSNAQQMRSHAQAMVKLEHLGSLTVPEMPNRPTIAAKSQDMARSARILQRLIVQSELVLPDLPDAPPKVSDAQAMRAAAVLLMGFQAHAAMELPAIPDTPAVRDNTALRRDVRALQEAVAKVVSSQSEYANADNDVKGTQHELESLIEELGGACPSCGHALEGELEHAH